MAKKRASKKKTTKRGSGRKTKARSASRSSPPRTGGGGAESPAPTGGNPGPDTEQTKTPGARGDYSETPKRAARKPRRRVDPASIRTLDVDRVGRAIENFASDVSRTPEQRDELAAFECLAEKWLETLPKRLWQRWSGRQPKILNEQARTYGLPLEGRTISLPMLAAAVHDFLAANANRLRSTGVTRPGGDPDAEDPVGLDGPASPALERWRTIRANREELGYRAEIGEFVEREKVEAVLAAIASRIERAGATLSRSHGDDAKSVVDIAVDSIGRDIAGLLGDDAQDDDEGGA